VQAHVYDIVQIQKEIILNSPKNAKSMELFKVQSDTRLDFTINIFFDVEIIRYSPRLLPNAPESESEAAMSLWKRLYIYFMFIDSVLSKITVQYKGLALQILYRMKSSAMGSFEVRHPPAQAALAAPLLESTFETDGTVSRWN